MRIKEFFWGIAIGTLITVLAYLMTYGLPSEQEVLIIESCNNRIVGNVTFVEIENINNTNKIIDYAPLECFINETHYNISCVNKLDVIGEQHE